MLRFKAELDVFFATALSANNNCGERLVKSSQYSSPRKDIKDPGGVAAAKVNLAEDFDNTGSGDESEAPPKRGHKKKPKVTSSSDSSTNGKRQKKADVPDELLADVLRDLDRRWTVPGHSVKSFVDMYDRYRKRCEKLNKQFVSKTVWRDIK